MSWSCRRHWALTRCKTRRSEHSNPIGRPPVARNAWRVPGFRGRMTERPRSLEARESGCWQMSSISSMQKKDLRRIGQGSCPIVCEPAALLRLSAFHEAVPQFVHFFLRLAGHEERDRRREGELRATVQRDELLTIELERHGHDRSFRTGPCIAVTHDADDIRALKNGGIEIR